jgi:hypothetical protein
MVTIAGREEEMRCGELVIELIKEVGGKYTNTEEYSKDWMDIKEDDAK